MRQSFAMETPTEAQTPHLGIDLRVSCDGVENVGDSD
jgi:hypothetical protein